MDSRIPNHENRTPENYRRGASLSAKRALAEWKQVRTAAEKQGVPQLALSMADGKLDEIRSLLKEYGKRKMMGVNLFRPQPTQLAFLKSQAPERLAVGGNRAMKTTAATYDFALSVMGRHPYWENCPKRDGRAILVGLDGRQLALFFKKLFRPLFKICKDPETGEWRAWKGYVPGEVPAKETVWAEPLIPDWFVENYAWENKGEGIPSLIKLKNGWELLFCSSRGKPPQGTTFDLAWFDEEIGDGDWYPEVAARLVDSEGRFMWSFTPQLATTRAADLRDEVLKQTGDNPRIEEFRFSIFENPYLSDRGKEEFIAKLADDDEEYRVRVLGEARGAFELVYPNFGRKQHCCEAFPVPDNWCNYLILDPGFANIFALFITVPDPQSVHAGHVYAFGECVGQRMSVRDYCAKLRSVAMGIQWRSFLIDAHGSMRTEVNGKSIYQQFSEEFARNDLWSFETGHAFESVGHEKDQYGTNLIKHQVSQVRSWLWDRDELGGRPKFQIMEKQVGVERVCLCPNLFSQMTKYRNKKKDGELTDEPDSRKNSHGPDTVRYAVLHGVPWKPNTVKPRSKKRTASEMMYRRVMKDRRSKNYLILGSSH